MNAGRTTYNFILMAVCMLLLSSNLLGQEEREYIRKGNKLYKKSEFAGSEGMYRRAQEQDKPFEDAGFNLGDALYKQGRFGEAAGEFSKAADGFAAAHCRLHTLSNYSTLILTAVETGYINDKDVETLKQWRTDPANWGIK